jgi:hypothetical protein
VIGGLIGVYFGWVRTPVSINSTSISALRSDYKTDYILMIAEVYASDNNINQAVASFSDLGDQPPLRYVQQAIIDAEKLGFSQQDLQLLAGLSSALQSPAIGTVTP